MSILTDPKDAVLFKCEDFDRGVPIGPVYVRRSGKTENYRNAANDLRHFDGEPCAEWFAAPQAHAIAADLSLPLVEL
jgi:hypothetical protein